jgi:voltage-gated potassium channel
MTVITLTTVGYGEVLPEFATVEHVRPFTILLIIMGMGVFLYFASTLTAFIIEGDLRRALQSTRMRKRLSRLEHHIIVCGAGSTGSHVIKELLATKTPVIAVDTDEEHLRELAREFGDTFLYVVGDATDDHVLEAARLREARGLVAALAGDKDNLYLVVSARQQHPDVDAFRIVARGSELNVLAKLQRAGANSVVSPNFIGGLRLASEMIRPSVVKFLDDMLRDQDATRLEDVVIHDGSQMAGRSMRSLDLRNRVNVSVLAIKHPEQQGYIYNPNGDLLLQAGMTLVVLGANQDVDKLRELAE